MLSLGFGSGLSSPSTSSVETLKALAIFTRVFVLQSPPCINLQIRLWLIPDFAAISNCVIPRLFNFSKKYLIIVVLDYAFHELRIVIFTLPMEFFINEHMKVEKVVSGVAYISAQIPVEMLDDIMALADHMIHASRWIKIRSRVCVATNTHGTKL